MQSCPPALVTAPASVPRDDTVHFIASQIHYTHAPAAQIRREDDPSGQAPPLVYCRACGEHALGLQYFRGLRNPCVGHPNTRLPPDKWRAKAAAGLARPSDWAGWTLSRLRRLEAGLEPETKRSRPGYDTSSLPHTPRIITLVGLKDLPPPPTDDELAMPAHAMIDAHASPGAASSSQSHRDGAPHAGQPVRPALRAGMLPA